VPWPATNRQHVRVQVEDWLSAFSERDLTSPRRYRWLDGRTLRSIIAETTYQRESKFLPAIETFAESWLSEEILAANNIIPLTMVEPLTEEEEDDSTN